MIPQIRVYIASKLKHAEKFQALSHSSSWEGLHMTANWVMQEVLAKNQIYKRPAIHWQQDNFDDIMRSHCVLAYVEHGDHLKGGLIEIGFALAHGKKIFLTSEKREDDNCDLMIHPDYSAWQMGSGLIVRSTTIERAVQDIKNFGWGKKQLKGNNGEIVEVNHDQMALK